MLTAKCIRMLQLLLPAASHHFLCHSCNSCSWSQSRFILPSHNGHLQVSPWVLPPSPPLRLHHPVNTRSLAPSLVQESVPSICAAIPSEQLLSKEQLLAVESRDTCVRVVAGPGSGKTRVLTHRVVHLVSKCGIPANEILFVTFTNKAAQEIKERLEQLFGSEAAKDMMVGTFHSICAKILRWKPCCGVNNKFAIFDEGDSERVVRSILKAAKNVLTQGCGEPMSSQSKATDNCSEHLLDLKSLGFLTYGSSENLFLKTCLASRDVSDGQSQCKTTIVSSTTIKSLVEAIRTARRYSMTCFLAERKKTLVTEIPRGLTQEKLQFTRLYENALRRSNALDFDDLIHLVVQLLHNNDDIRELCQERWKYILVDEFQDTDMVQYELICLLASKHRNLFVVGDIDQAIYGWRGAEFKHMQKSLERDFPFIQTFQLRENYRSSSYIVEAASVVLSFSRYDRRIGALQSLSLLPAVKEARAAPICIGDFNDQISEANFVVSEILKLVSTRKAVWGSFALLYRTRVQALHLGPALSRAKIPYRILGSSPFYTDKEVKTLLAYLQFISNSDNTFALEYCLNKPSRGIGDKTIEKLKEWARNNNISFPHALERIYAESLNPKQLGIRSSAREGIISFMKIVHSLRDMNFKSSVVHMTRTLIHKLNFEAHLEAISHDEEEYQRHTERLQQLLVGAANAEALYGLGDEALSRFLEDISLLASNEEAWEGEGAHMDEVKLSTLHASKGLEYDVVFLVGAQDDLIPLANADLDEERRLFYVGITRARKRLYLTYNRSPSVWRDCKPEMSRFVKELIHVLPSEYVNRLSSRESYEATPLYRSRYM